MTDMTGAVLNRLMELRKAKGMRQEDLANAAGVSRQTIIKIERGDFDSIQRDTIAAISDALGLPMHAWYTYIPEGYIEEPKS